MAAASPQLILPRSGSRTSVRRRVSRLGDRAAFTVVLGCALVSILTTAGIIGVLLFEAVDFFREISPLDFYGGTRWAATFDPPSFGVLPLVAGTFLVAAIAMVVALPVALSAAIYLAEYAAPQVRSVLKPLLEILAGIPTVVYGYFALNTVTPVIRIFLPETNVFNALSAGIVVGIMVIPLISSVSEDAMAAVPRTLREGAYALGATRLEVATRVVFPAALSGILASIILAISRAVGETLAVTIAAGATPRLTLNPLESVQTMSAYIVQISLGDAPFGSIEYRTIFAVGITLFVITFIFNLLSEAVLRRFREAYE